MEIRGGFQNRDVGRTSFDDDYGPEYGVDYARYSDPQNIKNDKILESKIEDMITLKFSHVFLHPEIIVRNGFVIIKGHLEDELLRNKIADEIFCIEGVEEVINQIRLKS